MTELSFLALASRASAGVTWWAASIAAVVWVTPFGASAQSSNEERVWIVVPVTTTDTVGYAEQAASQLSRTILADVGAPILPSEEANTLFETRESRPFLPPDLDVLVDVADHANAAVENAAYRRYGAARQHVAHVLARANESLDALNRELERAVLVLNACALDVELTLNAAGREAAIERALECRRLVPDRTVPTPDVSMRARELLREAEDQLARERHASLRVESTRRGCAVVLNGRNMGVADLDLPALPTGEYRIQLDCGHSMTRVHRVVLAAQQRTVEIDPVFDNAVQSEDTLELHYASQPAQARLRVDHGARLARRVGAAEIVLVSPTDGGVLLERVLSETARVTARVAVPLTGEGAADEQLLLRAGEAIMWNRSADLSQPAQLESLAAHAPEAVPTAVAYRSTSMPRVDDQSGSAWPGVVLAGAGTASYAASWYFVVRMLQANAAFADALPAEEGYLDLQREVDLARAPVVLTGSLGAALSITSLPFLLPEEDGVPWWSWLSGGVGAAALGAGIYVSVGADRCIDDACTRRFQGAVLGGELMLQAAPLLGLPITHLLRQLTESSVTASVRVAPRAAGLELGGEL